MFCNNCGRMLPEGSTFCGDCGSRQGVSDTSDINKQSVDLSKAGSVQSHEYSHPVAQPMAYAASPVQPQSAPYNPYQQPAPSYQQNTYTAPGSAQGQYPQNYVNTQEQYLNATPTVGEYIGIFFIECLPVINLIMLFVWAFGGATKNAVKNFARAQLILMAIGIGVVILFSALAAAFFAPFVN